MDRRCCGTAPSPVLVLSGASASASPPPRPDLLAADVNLMYTQLPGGDLVIGDRHEYAAVVDPFRAESRDRILLERAAELVGRASDDLVVVQRWQGVYASAP